MKRLLIFVLVFFSLNNQNIYKNQSGNIQCSSYIVLHQDTGEILEGKNIDRAQSVASISKIMTAILAIESDQLFTTTIVDESIDIAVGSSLYLQKGMYVTIIDMVYGLLLRSGNDASIIIAKTVSSSVENFVNLMNKKAFDLGLKNTVFSNPNGLDIYDNGNISTSYDMAKLMRYCMQNKVFRQIISTKRYNSYSKGWWKNKHKLLHTYKYCSGGKTGYTQKAKRTLITTAEKDNMKLIIVTLNCGNDFETHVNLFEKYFETYMYLPVLKEGNNKILDHIIVSDKTYGVLLNKESHKEGTLLYSIDIEKKIVTVTFITLDGIKEEIIKINILDFI